MSNRMKRVLLLFITGLFMSLSAVHFYCLGSNRADRFLILLTAITPDYGKKQMVIRMEICSTALGVQITSQ
ncbi:hypothetical protein [Bacillus halotolerans]|uniref:hypothetical protein n=1 Tax=Bacillus halotolerans TaxID=260554 RepID=UPI00374E0827